MERRSSMTSEVGISSFSISALSLILFTAATFCESTTWINGSLFVADSDDVCCCCCFFGADVFGCCCNRPSRSKSCQKPSSSFRRIATNVPWFFSGLYCNFGKSSFVQIICCSCACCLMGVVDFDFALLPFSLSSSPSSSSITLIIPDELVVVLLAACDKLSSTASSSNTLPGRVNLRRYVGGA